MEDNTPKRTVTLSGTARWGPPRLQWVVEGEPTGIGMVFDSIGSKPPRDAVSIDIAKAGPWVRERSFDPGNFATAIRDDFFADVARFRELNIPSTKSTYRWRAQPGNELVNPKGIEFEVWQGMGVFEVRIW